MYVGKVFLLTLNSKIRSFYLYYFKDIGEVLLTCRSTMGSANAFTKSPSCPTKGMLQM